MARYTVTGPRKVAGVEPGGDVEIPDEQADSLIAAGHITPKKPKRKKPTKKTTAEADD